MELKLFAFYIVEDVEKFNFGFAVIYKLWPFIFLFKIREDVMLKNVIN